MSSKESKPFEKVKHELKLFFRGNKSTPGSQVKLNDEYALTVAIEHQLSNQVPINQRLKTIKDLCEIVIHAKLEENAIEKICGCVDDILRDEQSVKESRRNVFYFYRCLIQGQYDRLRAMRPYFFNIIKTSTNSEDEIPRFELFQKLTEKGKNIVSFEEEVGRFLLDWMPNIVAAGRTSDFLHTLVNFIKYNSAYTDEDVINGIIEYTSYLCSKSDIEVVVSDSLDVLNAIVCYSNLSQKTMFIFISALSRTISLEKYNTKSWIIMRNLLGTHMGPFCLQTLCFMLQDENLYTDVGLISGIIFILNMALLNNKPEFIAGQIPGCIIPSILKASQRDHPVILVEVCLCIKWLVERHTEELKDPQWNLIFTMLESLISKTESNEYRHHIHRYIYDIFSKVEILLKNNQWIASMEKLFLFTQRRYFLMPEKLIFRLTDHFFRCIVSVEPSWTKDLEPFLTNFLIKENRVDVKIHILKEFVVVIQGNRYHHEEEIVYDIIKPYFSDLAFDKNDTVRNITLGFLIEFCLSCKPIHMEPILDIFEKVLKTLLEQNVMAILNHVNSADVKIVIGGLLNIFVSSIYQLPSSNTIKILDILVKFLNNHYEKAYVCDLVFDVRWMIIECFLKLRTDSKCRIGYTIDGDLRYSPYLVADYSRSRSASMSSSSRVNSKSSESSSFEEESLCCETTYVSLTNVCKVIVIALKEETDWKVLKLILQAIPIALGNRALIFSKYNSEVEHIVNALISMILDGNLPEPLKNTPPKFGKPDFYGYVVPVLSAFASYHANLGFGQQQRLIKCIELGLVDKSAPQCVTALMTCLLEMREAMVKLLPDILLTLSKISATVHVAIPILEFLSLLTTVPQVFANFIPSQYMSIFAIIFPYTNPFKYHHYIVSLAHHVIAAWFLKCRKPLRRDFVKYIIKGLQSNISGSFDEGHFNKSTTMNEDSSNRKRSSSLTEQGNRRKDRLMNDSGRLMSSHTSAAVPNLRKDIDETSIQFHRELTETCIDLMSRVAFTSCSALPKRHPSTDFILRNGLSATWIVGNRLITVTTSGCTQKPMYGGLCDKCYSSCLIDKTRDTELNSFGKNSELINIYRDNHSGSFISNGKQLSRHLSLNSDDGTSGENSRGSVSTENISGSSALLSENEEKKIVESIEKNKQITINKEEREIFDVCTCWCQGWAEVHIRRPTGDTAWLMRLQNETFCPSFTDPFVDASTLNQASVIREGIKISETLKMLQIQNELKSAEEEINKKFSADVFEKANASVVENNQKSSEMPPNNVETNCPVKNDYTRGDSSNSEEQEDEDRNDDCCHSRNPVRRSNSSPEMSSSWKNSFIKNANANGLDPNDNDVTTECKKTGKNCYSKELRCDCEAIPEEFPGLGTTPPKQGVTEPSSDVLPTNSDSESITNSTSPSVSPYNVSRTDVSNSAPQLPPSHSYENVDLSADKKKESKFFDDGLPNDDFEFSRSASTSQVISGNRKCPPTSSYAMSHFLASSQPHLTAKPPPSPPTYSLRSINKHGKDYSSADSQSDSFSQLNTDYKRGRVHTISVMSPSKNKSEWDLPRNKFSGVRNNEPKKFGVNPSFVFLQLYYSSQFINSTEQPMLVPSTVPVQRAMNVFDLIPPYETHKIGVIYVGSGQANNEAEILRNTTGSTRYTDFLSKLGTLVSLNEVNPQNVFLGGLEQSGNDGKFAYIWKDDITQIIFHVATLMPNKENDANCNNKKKHIGNDYVTIVFNESGEEYDLRTVKCQFSFACIIVEPLDHGSNQVTIKARTDLLDIIGNVETKIVSDKNVSVLARQFALHINLASLVMNSMKDKNYGAIYASNWLERLRKIKQIKKKVADELKISTNASEVANRSTNRRNYVCDFTEYT